MNDNDNKMWAVVRVAAGRAGLRLTRKQMKSIVERLKGILNESARREELTRLLAQDLTPPTG